MAAGLPDSGAAPTAAVGGSAVGEGPLRCDADGFPMQDLWSLPPVKSLARSATAVVWWQSPEGPLALVGTKSSTLLVVDLCTGMVRERLSVPGRSAVTGLKLVYGLQDSFSVHALVQADNTHSTLLLQHAAFSPVGEAYVEYLLSPGRRGAAFAAVKAPWKSRAPATLHEARGEIRITARLHGLVSVYGDLNGNPLYVYCKPEGTRLLGTSDHLMYCLTAPETGPARMHVVSCLLAASAVSTNDAVRVGDGNGEQ